MDKIINWDDYPETSFITEEGTYTLKVISHERKNTPPLKNFPHSEKSQTTIPRPLNLPYPFQTF